MEYLCKRVSVTRSTLCSMSRQQDTRLRMGTPSCRAEDAGKMCSMTARKIVLRAMLGTGYRLARYRGISRLGRIISWHAMRGFMNSRNHDMTRNGERWLVERLAPALAGRSVIDVGANAGSWSDLVLQASPTSKVYTVEMIPTFVSNLRRRFGEKLTVIEAALSDRAEAVTGYRFGGGGRIPKGLGSGKEAEGFEMCTRTGDNLVRELGLNDVA